MIPERHNAIKVLLCLDIGGSMDDHIRICEEMFSAARSEFKHLEYFYFHNFIYESMWKDNRRRQSEKTPTLDITHKYGPDYKLIFVGDATMSPYEIVYAGGSVEHWNEEPGAVWIKRLLNAYPKAVWLNPEPEERWGYTPSTKLIRELMDERMYPLTIFTDDSHTHASAASAQDVGDITGRRGLRGRRGPASSARTGRLFRNAWRSCRRGR